LKVEYKQPKIKVRILLQTGPHLTEKKMKPLHCATLILFLAGTLGCKSTNSSEVKFGSFEKVRKTSSETPDRCQTPRKNNQRLVGTYSVSQKYLDLSDNHTNKGIFSFIAKWDYKVTISQPQPELSKKLQSICELKNEVFEKAADLMFEGIAPFEENYLRSDLNRLELPMFSRNQGSYHKRYSRAFGLRIESGEKTKIKLAGTFFGPQMDKRPMLVIGPELKAEDMERLILQTAYLTGIIFRFDYATSGETLAVDSSIIGSEVSVDDLRDLNKILLDKPRYTSRLTCITVKPSVFCEKNLRYGYKTVNMTHSDWRKNHF